MTDINESIVDLKLSIPDAALVRSYLFLHTSKDSYEFPSQRTVSIRNFIRQLDEQIEANLPEDQGD